MTLFQKSIEQSKKTMITAYKDIQKIISQSQQPIEQITELDLSSVKIFRFTDKIKSLIQQCKMLAILKLSQCELNSLDKLPNLTGLVGLDVSGNKLKDADLLNLIKYPNLSILNLSDNFIQHSSSLEHIKKLTKIKDLQLAGNQIQKNPQYREQIFRQIKGLELLDKLDCTGQPPVYDSYSDDQLSQQQDQDDNGMDYFDQQEDSEDNEDQQEQSEQRNHKKHHKE